MFFNICLGIIVVLRFFVFRWLSPTCHRKVLLINVANCLHISNECFKHIFCSLIFTVHIHLFFNTANNYLKLYCGFTVSARLMLAS